MVSELSTLIDAMANAERQRADNPNTDDGTLEGMTEFEVAVPNSIRPPKGARVKFTPSLSPTATESPSLPR